MTCFAFSVIEGNTKLEIHFKNMEEVKPTQGLLLQIIQFQSFNSHPTELTHDLIS